MSIMTKLVITTETRSILRGFIEGRCGYMIFVTNDDIVSNKCGDIRCSVKSMNMVTYKSTKYVYFHKKCSYPEHKEIYHYYLGDYPKTHFKWCIPECLYPIYCYGLTEDCGHNTIDEIIRDYSKVQEEQKMLHFDVTDVTFCYYYQLIF